MPKVRSVVALIFAALVTVGMAAIGLYRAAQVWKALVAGPACPAPPPAIVSAPAPEPAPVAREDPKNDVRIGVLSVGKNAAVIEVGGRRHELAGYPPPSSVLHPTPALTTAVVSPDGRLVAIAGDCHGPSDEGSIPSCARVFVRVYRVTDGSHVRDLKTRWNPGDDLRQPLAIAFDERAERLAVVIRAAWADCMWEGDTVELFVYQLADGARLARRILANDEQNGTRSLAFVDDAVRVTTVYGHGRPKVSLVRLRKPAAR